MRVSIWAGEQGLEVRIEDADFNIGSDFISWDEIAKHLAPHLPLPPAPTTGDDTTKL